MKILEKKFSQCNLNEAIKLLPQYEDILQRDYEFVDVVDDDLDYSVYDSDKINEKVNLYVEILCSKFLSS